MNIVETSSSLVILDLTELTAGFLFSITSSVGGFGSAAAVVSCLRNKIINTYNL